MTNTIGTKRPEPYVGQKIEPKPFTLTPELLEHYRGGLDVEARPSPPLMVANAAETTLLFSQQKGHLWLRQEWEFFAPLQEGATYTVDGSVIDIYPRRERTILLTETFLRDSAGNVVSVQRHHQSFLLNQPEGEVQLRDPKQKEGARTFEVPAGKDLGSIERKVTLEMCGEFFHGSRSYHSDKEASKELGFSDVVVGGRMSMGYVGELLESALGDAWARSGRLLVKFTNVLWPDETIRVRGVLPGPLEDDPSRQRVFAWVEKSDGTIVLVAEGSFAG